MYILLPLRRRRRRWFLRIVFSPLYLNSPPVAACWNLSSSLTLSSAGTPRGAEGEQEQAQEDPLFSSRRERLDRTSPSTLVRSWWALVYSHTSVLPVPQIPAASLPSIFCGVLARDACAFSFVSNPRRTSARCRIRRLTHLSPCTEAPGRPSPSTPRPVRPPSRRAHGEGERAATWG